MIPARRAFEKANRRTAHKVRSILVKRFPQTFGGRGKIKRPLKTGIHEDIAAACPDLSHEEIKLALWDYCTGMKYLQELVTGASRIGLDGLPHGQVSKVADARARERVTRQEAGRAAAVERERLRLEYAPEGVAP